MGRPSLSPEIISANKAAIISAAKDMIHADGISSVSARSLGAAVGMNSALIYRYFRDIDEVILFACVHVLQEYTIEMRHADRSLIPDESEARSLEVYLLSWKLFCQHAFSHPEAYNMLFFSKHSTELERVIKEYYELFPEEFNGSDDILLQTMFNCSDLKSRNMMLLIPLLEGQRSEDEIILINNITIGYFYSTLSDFVRNSSGLNVEDEVERMLNACRYLISL